MEQSQAFESLVGIYPGVTTVSHVTARFGAPETSPASDDGLLLEYVDSGVVIFVAAADCGASDPIVDEVRVTSGAAGELPCGVRIGQPQAEAIDAVRRAYRVKDEYDDSVYFWPSERDDLLACVEFWESGVVEDFELMRWRGGDARNG